jgi:hypothetical protein
VPFGIDVDPLRVEHARGLHPDFAPNFVAGDLFDDQPRWWDGTRFALAIFMPGRLHETGPEQAVTLRAQLRAHCDQVLVYAYGDWLTRATSLAALARQAGFAVLGPADAPAALAHIVDTIPEEARHGT